MNTEFNGFLGVMIFVVTIAALIIIAFVSLIIYNSTAGSNIKPELRWSKYFLISAGLFLLFDCIFYVLIFLQGPKIVKSEDASAFDRRMLYIWVPIHLFGYFLTATGMRAIKIRRERISRFIDKYR
jgi:hypothetical protein